MCITFRFWKAGTLFYLEKEWWLDLINSECIQIGKVFHPTLLQNLDIVRKHSINFILYQIKESHQVFKKPHSQWRGSLILGNLDALSSTFSFCYTEA